MTPADLAATVRNALWVDRPGGMTRRAADEALAELVRLAEQRGEALRLMRRGFWNEWHNTPARDAAEYVLVIDHLLGIESDWRSRFAAKFPEEWSRAEEWALGKPEWFAFAEVSA